MDIEDANSAQSKHRFHENKTDDSEDIKNNNDNVQQVNHSNHSRAMVLPSLPSPRSTAINIASYLISGVLLWLALQLKLLGGLFAGLLVFQLIHMLIPPLEKRLPGPRARWIAVVLLAVVITGALAAIILAAISQFQHNVPSMQKLLDQLMQIIDRARGHLPDRLWDYLPDRPDELRDYGLNWLKSHIGELQQRGKNAVRSIFCVGIGMVLGAIVAVTTVHHTRPLPLAAALTERIGRFSGAFRHILFAQVKISLINAFFTGAYLLLILPLFHARLPLSKTLVGITFIVGLLPVAGNLLSNTLIVIISLASGLSVAIASLVFLIAIHKFEYFLNARIIGVQIEARAWELLLAMLVMEAAFGLSGVVAAPIYYAYVKRELSAAKLV